MTEQERKLKAKIPGADTGIEIRRTICDICSPAHHCGINAYVKDETVIKVEGTDGHLINDGKLCTKGLSNRAYIYRKDRIRTPLRRVGERGAGEFEAISWEEAYAEIATRLGQVKAAYGPEAVAFYSGYSKWYRPMLRRFAHAFGSPNYGSESSACYTSAYMAWKLCAGEQCDPDMANCDLLIGWAFNPYCSNYRGAKRVTEMKERGVKFLIVDTHRTAAVEKLADLALFPKPGTDGALALAIANELIRMDAIDHAFIEQYTYGFEAYKDYAAGFNETNIEALTGVSYEDVVKAARMIADSKRMAINESSAPLCHHRNGLQNYRATRTLLALTGNLDRKGGSRPNPHSYIYVSCGFDMGETAFAHGLYPQNAKLPVGAERFPLWNELEREMQAMDLPRQIKEGTPYPVKAVFALGMNARMWPESGYMFEALTELDFFVDADLFLTDTAKYADIVLPVCSSFERGEFKPYTGGRGIYTKPAIAPLYESKSDVEILTDLANRMDLPDPLLKAGYKACVQSMLDNIGVNVEDLEAADLPIPMVSVVPDEEEANVRAGLHTPTGKFEFSSALLEAHPEWGLDPLPTYWEPLDDADPALYPFVLTEGPRVPSAIHSRLHKVPTVRSLRPDAMADISREDAARLGIEPGDDMEIVTERGSITVKANPTLAVFPGIVNMFHGYSEADVSSLLDRNHLDPYSGFPAFRTTRCTIRKK